jgi:hypothetical protein
MIRYALVVALLAGPAAAEQPSGPPLPTLMMTVDDDAGGRRLVRCGDFTKDADGSWSSVRQIRIGDFYLAPPVQFSLGMPVNGVPVVAILDARCQGRPT